jgi:hypothetical protein
VWPAFRSARLAPALLRIDVMNIAPIRGIFNSMQFHLVVFSQVVILSLLPALYFGQIVEHLIVSRFSGLDSNLDDSRYSGQDY